MSRCSYVAFWLLDSQQLDWVKKCQCEQIQFTKIAVSEPLSFYKETDRMPVNLPKALG